MRLVGIYFQKTLPAIPAMLLWIHFGHFVCMSFEESATMTNVHGNILRTVQKEKCIRTCIVIMVMAWYSSWCFWKYSIDSVLYFADAKVAFILKFLENCRLPHRINIKCKKMGCSDKLFKVLFSNLCSWIRYSEGWLTFIWSGCYPEYWSMLAKMF